MLAFIQDLRLIGSYVILSMHTTARIRALARLPIQGLRRQPDTLVTEDPRVHPGLIASAAALQDAKDGARHHAVFSGQLTGLHPIVCTADGALGLFRLQFPPPSNQINL